jgi:hypothetical protein
VDKSLWLKYLFRRLFMNSIKDIVSKGIKEYNSYRNPEVLAEMLTHKGDEFTLKFSGPFCHSCGVYDYFEDLIYELKEIRDLDCKIVNVEEKEGNFFVTYRIKPIKE